MELRPVSEVVRELYIRDAKEEGKVTIQGEAGALSTRLQNYPLPT
jgi:hypothetical protein